MKRVLGSPLPKATSTHKSRQEAAFVVGAHQGTVAEALPYPLTFHQGVRLAPSATAIGATVDEDVDVFGQVYVVVFPLVGGDNQRTVFGRDDGGNAVVL